MKWISGLKPRFENQVQTWKWKTLRWEAEFQVYFKKSNGFCKQNKRCTRNRRCGRARPGHWSECVLRNRPLSRCPKTGFYDMMEGTGANMESILDLDYGITSYGISSSETKLDSLLLRKELIHREIFILFHFLRWSYAQAFCPSS